jgi:hypothetical protein
MGEHMSYSPKSYPPKFEDIEVWQLVREVARKSNQQSTIQFSYPVISKRVL